MHCLGVWTVTHSKFGIPFLTKNILKILENIFATLPTYIQYISQLSNILDNFPIYLPLANTLDDFLIYLQIRAGLTVKNLKEPQQNYTILIQKSTDSVEDFGLDTHYSKAWRGESLYPTDAPPNNSPLVVPGWFIHKKLAMGMKKIWVKKCLKLN